MKRPIEVFLGALSVQNPNEVGLICSSWKKDRKTMSMFRAEPKPVESIGQVYLRYVDGSKCIVGIINPIK